MDYILGVDGGGTKTLALLGGPDGSVLARGVSGPSNYNAIGFGAACSELESAIHIAHRNYPGEISALCMGLAGVGRKEDVELFQKWAVDRFPKAAVKVASDAEILLMAGAPSGPALLLICGTGSIVYGRTVTGEILRAGGWGYLFGDEGSGYAIGSMALRAVMKAYDGRAAKTLLSELILERYGLRTPSEIVRTVYGSDSPHATVAALSDLVEYAAGHGDSVAMSILEESADELARAIAVIYSKLETSAVPLIISGGTILHGRHLKDAFQRKCESEKLVFTVVRYVEEPAEVALKLAQKLSLGEIENS
jgi:N-acetylglucosamine kinase-like BadF-type ATPase